MLQGTRQDSTIVQGSTTPPRYRVELFESAGWATTRADAGVRVVAVVASGGSHHAGRLRRGHRAQSHLAQVSGSRRLRLRLVDRGGEDAE